VRWWRKSPGRCSSLLICLSPALLPLGAGKSASSTAVSTNTVSSLPYPDPAGGLHPGPAWFIDVAQQAGLRMNNLNGGVESKKYIIETTGSGVAIFDYDNDGWPDIFLVNGNTLDQAKGRSPEPGSHLFHKCQIARASAPRLQSLRKVIDLCKKCSSGSSYISNNDGGLHFGLGKQWRGRSHQDSLAKRQQREFFGRTRRSFFITLIEGRSGTPHDS
jgi:hypothetical protein